MLSEGSNDLNNEQSVNRGKKETLVHQKSCRKGMKKYVLRRGSGKRREEVAWSGGRGRSIPAAAGPRL